MPTSRKRKKNNHTSLESSAISSPTNWDDTNEADGDVNSHGELVTPSSTQAPQTTDEEELQRARLTYTKA
ncbi:hypothetical protein PSHT_00831 [Puccinia striiformis]|uniref:Uncharacterized protein n=1 Tax=Puccinia striiformis TaxID=27350 RepID=A0A2S4WLX3_9BASI|nr:hypothetical protein PSHT_00831 [Puccinia striiformis]